MKNQTLFTIAAVAAGLFFLNKSKVVSGIGAIKHKKFVGKVTKVKYRNTSQYGNPSYWIEVEDAHGNVIGGYTAPDANMAYGIENRQYRDFDHVYTYHDTASGNTIFEYVSKL